MSPSPRSRIVQDSYRAFAAGDRAFFETHLAGDLRFSSPPDPELDRAGWFARCWPHAGTANEVEYARVIEAGDEIVVTYEQRRPDGTGLRNTEVITFDADNRIARIEVYFGWDLPTTRPAER
jgi:ketosteroid isomerase-like protein